MKAIVVYCSKRGSTKEYAEWISEDISKICTCEIVESSKIKDVSLSDYDLIIYGGWIRGSGIVDFDKFSKFLDGELMEKLIVFGVGIAIPTPENYMQVWSLNIGKVDPKNLHKSTLYIFDGAYCPEKISGLDKMLMGVAKKIMLSGATRDDLGAAGEMKKRIEDGINLVKRENIEALIKESQKRLKML